MPTLEIRDRWRRRNPRFADYSRAWLDAQRLRLAVSTLESYSGVLHRYLLPALGRTRVRAIDSDTVNRLLITLAEGGGHGGKPLAVRTVEFARAVLSQILGTAVSRDLLERNPCWGTVIPDGRTKRHYPVWAPEELASFLSGLQGHKFETLIRFAAATGMRRGEICGLRWQDVEPSGLIHVRWALTYSSRTQRFSLGLPKSHQMRSLQIDPATCLMMDRHRLTQALLRSDGGLPFPDRPVFPGPGGGWGRPNLATDVFRAAVRSRSDLPQLRFHDLRHTHATLLLTAGVPVHVVAGRLGHSGSTTIRYYAHQLPAADATAADTYAALLSAAIVHPAPNEMPAIAPLLGTSWRWRGRQGSSIGYAAEGARRGRSAG